jgi:hypothetical protein
MLPFYPSKVIHRLPITENSASESSSSESKMDQPLSPDPTITSSSSVDISTFGKARQKLSQYVSEDPAFKTPVRNFVDRFAKCSKRIWARSSILETNCNDLKKVIMHRKKCSSSVRAVLKGKHIVNADDVFEEVKKAEEAVRKRKTKNPWKRKARSNSIQNEQELDPEDNIGSEDREIADCIVVQS